MQWWRYLRGALEPHSVDPHRPSNVLELLLANILEGDFETPVDILLHPAETQIPPGSASASVPIMRNIDSRTNTHAHH